MDAGTPHRMVDNILNSVTGGAQGLVSGVTGGLTGAGEMVQQGLDAPFKALGIGEHPLRALDRLLDGSIRAAEHSINQGVIGTVRKEGEAVQSALDHPSEQFGIPPKLGAGMSQGFGRSKLRGGMPRMPWDR